MPKLNNLFLNLATFGFSHKFRGSGTVGSLAALPFVYLLSFLNSCFWQVIALLLFSIFSYFIIRKACEHFVSEDPPQIILDEFVGCIVSFCCVSLSLWVMVIGFLLFRFFDITKTLGISFLEKKFKGPFGILLDDLIAGLFVNTILHIYFF